MENDATNREILEGSKEGLSVYEGLKLYPEIHHTTHIARANARNLPLSKVHSNHRINRVYQEIVSDLVKQ